MRNVKRRQRRKLPPKKKRVKAWCSGGGKRLGMLTARAHAYLEKVGSLCKEDEDNVTKIRKRWRTRCSVCNRRLYPKPQFFGSEREFFDFWLPAHKAA